MLSSGLVLVQSTSCSSLGSELRLRRPSSATTTRSSIRTPSPGHHLVYRPCLLAGLAGGEGAGAVGAVAVQLRSHVEDDELAATDRPLARLGVREGAVGTGGDDRREGRLGAELADAGFGRA